jgi:polyisoprenoid-binding protein YceI
LTRITGKFTDFSIDLHYVDKDLTKSSLSVSINVASINTGNPARDEDLKTKDFFDIDNYSKSTFLSDSIIKNNEGYTAYGKLFLHGITKDIALTFKVTGMDGDDVIGFSSRYNLKRSDFGVGTEFKHTTEDNFIGNDIGIEIDFWTKRAKEKKN